MCTDNCPCHPGGEGEPTKKMWKEYNETTLNAFKRTGEDNDKDGNKAFKWGDGKDTTKNFNSWY
jgi:hypothetical protein